MGVSSSSTVRKILGENIPGLGDSNVNGDEFVHIPVKKPSVDDRKRATETVHKILSELKGMYTRWKSAYPQDYIGELQDALDGEQYDGYFKAFAYERETNDRSELNLVIGAILIDGRIFIYIEDSGRVGTNGMWENFDEWKKHLHSYW